MRRPNSSLRSLVAIMYIIRRNVYIGYFCASFAGPDEIDDCSNQNYGNDAACSRTTSDGTDISFAGLLIRRALVESEQPCQSRIAEATKGLCHGSCAIHSKHEVSDGVNVYE